MAAEEATLAIANSQRLTVYWNPVTLHTADALMKLGSMDAATAVSTAYGEASAWGIPIYEPLVGRCKEPLLQQPDRLDICRRLASVFRQGDTYITVMIGTVIAKRTWPEGTVEYQKAVETRRTLHYQLGAEMEAGTKLGFADKWAELNLRLLKEHDTEQQVAVGVIEAAGLSATPSADWVDRQQP
jgi:hypothetical protein